MLLRIFVALIVLIALEVSILLEVYRMSANAWGRGFGLLVTFGSVALGGLLGILLIRHQGMSVLRKLKQAAAQGESPSVPLMDAALVLFGGILLLVPGLLSDAVGLTMCIPVTRRLWRGAFVWWIRRQIKRKTVTVRTYTTYAEQPDAISAPDQQVIDVTPHEPLNDESRGNR